ncbi:tRNA uridine-5-carboxymethylaminomethyl(34) synthesis GTPase MnmE [Porticoccus sp.]|uniref:tRNA uridine-5-carboxymethylaminomethyl(34) synthesis GTPase MnmE n=1 Tax=Porticoccus sp. TaxID=2024853 RepID=UPI003F69A39D
MNGLSHDQDVIVAVATPPGRGGVGVVRISGLALDPLINGFIGRKLEPRQAVFTDFHDAKNQVIDRGLAIYFPAPHSFTGEHVLELQGHGGPVIMDMLLQRAIQLGARLARPGEFSQRAFLNDKLDLTQAEAIADLIDATSEQAARCAIRSLQGAFSTQIHQLLEALTALRIYVEAAIDFPEEEVDFLADGRVSADLNGIIIQLDELFYQARQGALLKEGMTVVIAGKPNAGKSSLLNALSGRDSAIVTEVEGTTRDLLREEISLDGMPLHVIDTAGLRDTGDPVEKEGIRRAWQAIEGADRILFVVDSSQPYSLDPKKNWPDYFSRFPQAENISFILNKADTSTLPVGITEDRGHPVVTLSVKQGLGLNYLVDHLKQCMGYTSSEVGSFAARRRHLDALERAQQYLHSGVEQLHQAGAGELLAEDLRLAQQCLAEITGEFTSDDLLGRIFASFCIGK